MSTITETTGPGQASTTHGFHSNLHKEGKRRELNEIKPICKTQEEFVREVIYDGRHLSSFTENPELTAKCLGIGVQSTVIQQIKGKNPTLVLADAITWMTEKEAEERAAANIAVETPVAGFLGAAIVLWIVIDRVAEWEHCSIETYIDDLSDEAAAKL